MNYILGRDTILILVNLNGEGQVIVFRGILRYSVSSSQNATCNGYGRKIVIHEICVFSVDVLTLDIGQGIYILKGYVQSLVIEIQAFNTLVSHVANIPFTTVIVPALFITRLGRLNGIASRQRYQTICFFRISGDTDICTGGRASDIQSSFVLEVYVILCTRGLVVIDYNVVLNSCICGLADVHARTLLSSLIAGNLHIIRDMQAAVGLSLGVGVYACTISCGIIGDFSIIRDVDLAAVANKECTAASGCGVAFDNNAFTNVQDAMVSCQCTCSALHCCYVVNATARNRCVSEIYSTLVGHVDYSTVVGASGTVKINMIEVYDSAACYFNEARLSADRCRTDILNLVIRGTVGREIDSLGAILKLEFLRCADIGHQHDVDFVLTSCSCDGVSDGHIRISIRTIAASIAAACGAVGYIVGVCCGYKRDTIVCGILLLSCRSIYIIGSILSCFVRRNVRGNFLPF